MALALAMAVGCRSMNEFGDRAPCILSEQHSAPAIIAHVNENVARIQSWRTFNAEISTPALPFKVNASVAVEAPRNFRLVVRSPFGPEVDLGSNSEHYWFWSRQDESKRIYLANHETVAGVDSPVDGTPAAGMPFQPEWIMEAMGVIAIDPAKTVEFNRDPQARTITLSENRLSPQGEPVRKLTVIDLCHGIVREHALVDAQGRLIARALLQDHVRDKASGGVMPARIRMLWPRANIDMTMSLKALDVNVPIKRSTFMVQSYNGCTVQQVGGSKLDSAEESPVD